MSAALPALAHGTICLEPLAEAHRAALKSACAADQDIWGIYSIDLRGDGFDRWFEAVTEEAPGPQGWSIWAFWCRAN